MYKYGRRHIDKRVRFDKQEQEHEEEDFATNAVKTPAPEEKSDSLVNLFVDNLNVIYGDNIAGVISSSYLNEQTISSKAQREEEDALSYKKP